MDSQQILNLIILGIIALPGIVAIVRWLRREINAWKPIYVHRAYLHGMEPDSLEWEAFEATERTGRVHQVVEIKMDASTGGMYIDYLKNPNAPMQKKVEAIYGLATRSGFLLRDDVETLIPILESISYQLKRGEKQTSDLIVLQKVTEKAQERLIIAARGKGKKVSF